MTGEDEQGCPDRCSAERTPAEPPATADCSTAGDRLVECALLPEPVLECNNQRFLDRCLSACHIDAPCEELSQFYCLSTLPSDLGVCFAACRDADPGFICDDGTVLVSGWQCDNEPDCLGGEDEIGCPALVCNDGVALPISWKCDGLADCLSGEDELDCVFLTCG